MAKSDPRPLISIVIPVFNEERNVRLAYDAVTGLFETLADRYRLELFFSDNHSTDGTEAELEKLTASDPRVKVIRLARNFGFQRSVMTAYRHVTGDAAIQLDCDLQDPTDIIPEFLKLWEEGHDVVVGIRRKRQEGRALQAGRRAFYRLVKSISDDNIVENAGDFRLVDRSVLDRLAGISDARPYTRGLVSSLAVSQVGVEYDRAERQFEQSKFPLRRLLGFATDGIVSHSLVPLRMASVVGLFVFCLSLVMALYYIVTYFFFGASWPRGFATLVIFLLMSISLNAIFIGIVGEYVGRIYDEVRTRPLSLIEKSVNLDQTTPAAKPASKARSKT